jgi:SAM-dependent methyltransferase
MADLEFRRDLYRGTASYYDRFRVPYPKVLFDDLLERLPAADRGMLLDLACGTGQITFALHDRFAEVWAADQEPEMTDMVRQKAAAAGIANIRVLTATAEDLPAPAASFDLVAIGNAFHRLPRAAVAASALRWLRPGTFLTLLFSGINPWEGEAPWQRAMASVVTHWRSKAADGDRIPPGYERDRQERPDLAVLQQAGFEVIGAYQFLTVHAWTVETLTGYAFSTSVLSRAALGGDAPGFEADLRRELGPFASAGALRQTIDFNYMLARRPAGL